MSTPYLLAVAVCAALLAGAIYFVLVRPVESRTVSGAIIEKTYADERTITRTNAGPRRELWTQNRIKIPEGYIFTIRLANGGDVYFMVEKTAGEPFQVGQKVQVSYDERGIPPLWTKRFVRSMTPATTP